jgi:P27 family predicted phage terminase small subunit
VKGRPRTPTPAKILHGTFRRDRANRNEPQPEAPKELKAHEWLDNYGRDCWGAHVPELVRLGVLTSLDVLLFAGVCERWSTYRRAVDDSKKTLTHRTKANGTCSKPQVAIAKAAFDSFRQGLEQFGCSPATRAKVSATPPADDDPFAAFRAKKPQFGARRFLA